MAGPGVIAAFFFFFFSFILFLISRGNLIWGKSGAKLRARGKPQLTKGCGERPEAKGKAKGCTYRYAVRGLRLAGTSDSPSSEQSTESMTPSSSQWHWAGHEGAAPGSAATAWKRAEEARRTPQKSCSILSGLQRWGACEEPWARPVPGLGCTQGSSLVPQWQRAPCLPRFGEE